MKHYGITPSSRPNSVRSIDQEESLFIKLGELVEIDNAPFLNDSEWLQHEEKRKRKALAKTPDMPLFIK